MAVVLLNHQIIEGYIAACTGRTASPSSDRRHHASEAYGPYRSVEDALAEYLDMNMVELGHGLHDIKIHSCTKEDEVEIGKPERTIVIEPVEVPVPGKKEPAPPEPEYVPEPVKVPEKVPVPA